MTTVHVVRHAEVHNPKGLVYGRLPRYVLSTKGHAQVKATTEWLVNEGNIVYAATSPLTRAKQTALPFLLLTDIPVSVDDNLIEVENVFEGQRMVGPFFRDPKNWKHLRNPFNPSWGEEYEGLYTRMMSSVATVRDLAAQHGGDGVVYSHQVPIWVLRLGIEGREFFHDPRRRQCTHASVTSVKFGTSGGVESITYREPARGVKV